MTDRTRHALLLLHHHRPAEAERELRAHLAEHPHDGTALALLSSAQSAQGAHAEAVATAHALAAMAPEDAGAHFHLAKALLGKGEPRAALVPGREAVRLDPDDADHHMVVALAHHHLHEHAAALQAAERGLALDPEHLGCLNIRSSELAAQRRFAEADEVTAKLLQVDPENAHSHANTGWTRLRQGDHAGAMHHFREALRREPGMEHARLGMVEALKARYWPYRQWLRYVFWVGNLKPGMQTAFIIGIWVLMRVLGNLGEQVPSLRLVTLPLLVLYMLFAFSTWVIAPLTNLLLRLHPFGRLVLDRDERTTSGLTGVALSLSVVGGIAALFVTGWAAGGLALALFGLLMMVPMASMLSSARRPVRRFRIGFAGLLALVGLAGVSIAFLDGVLFNGPMAAFGIGAIAYQWITALFVRD